MCGKIQHHLGNHDHLACLAALFWGNFRKLVVQCIQPREPEGAAAPGGPTSLGHNAIPACGRVNPLCLAGNLVIEPRYKLGLRGKRRAERTTGPDLCRGPSSLCFPEPYHHYCGLLVVLTSNYRRRRRHRARDATPRPAASSMAVAGSGTSTR